MKKLRKLLCYLYDNNPYYSAVMHKLGCNPFYDNISKIYSSLPLMKKEDLLNNMNLILTPSLLNSDSKYDLTSGTTGNVIKCYKTKSERSNLAINIWRKRREIDKRVKPSNYISLFNNDFERLFGKFYNTSEESIIKIFKVLEKLNPRWLSGPISIFEKMAMLIQSGINVNFNNLTVIEFMGEYVEQNKRKFIEKFFNCRTVNNYGCQEVWCMAFECRHEQLHIQEEFCYLEHLRPQLKNKDGEIILTSFNNYLMPIIKYRIGDIGHFYDESCNCECDNMCLFLAGGRSGEYIKGTNILGNYFFDQVAWQVNSRLGCAIYAFRVIQRSVMLFEFQIVKGRDFNYTCLEEISNRLKKEINKDITIEYRFFDSLEFGKHGKLSKFISLCEGQDL